MILILKTFLFFFSLISYLLFCFKISKKYLKIENLLEGVLSALILEVFLIIFFANLFLFFKIYNFLSFFIVSVFFFLFSINELRTFMDIKFNLNIPLFYKIFLFLFIFIIIFIFFEGLFTPPLSWDSLYYHMFQAALFIQEGGFSPLPFDGILGSFKYHPKNYEIFLSFFLLFFKSDFLANLCNFFFFLIFLLSVLILMKEFKIKSERIVLFLINFFTIPAFFIYLPTQYVETASLSLIVSSFSFIKIFERSKNIYFLLISSLSLSISISFKAYNFLPFLLGHLFLFYLLIKNRSMKLKILLLLSGIILFFSFHYIKMFLNYKNPFYPYPLKIAGKDIGEVENSVKDYFEKIEEKQREWFSKYGSKLSPLEKKLAPYLYTIFTMYSQNHQGLGRPALLYSILGIIGLILLKEKIWKIFLSLQLFLFLLQFFSPQMEPLRITFSLSYSRIFLFPVFMLTFLSLTIFQKYKIYDFIFIFGFLTHIFLILPENLLTFHIYIFLISLLFLIIFIILFFRFTGYFVFGFFLIFNIVSPLIYHIKEKERLNFYLNFYHVSKISRSVFPVATFLNGKKAVLHCHIKDDYFSPNPLLPYPLLGTRFENKIVFVNPKNLSFEEWVERLKKEKVDLILLKGTDTIDFKWVSSHGEYFEFLFEREGIFVYNFVPK